MFYYGLVSAEEAREIAEKVSSALDGGEVNQLAVDLMLETAAQETHLGKFRDESPYNAGVGLCQIDLIAFIDMRNRVRDDHKATILHAFNIDLNEVTYRELSYSPLLSFIYCRLYYKLIPDPIPDSLDGRAQYWKEFYNTARGKGSPGDYVKNARAHLTGV